MPLLQALDDLAGRMGWVLAAGRPTPSRRRGADGTIAAELHVRRTPCHPDRMDTQAKRAWLGFGAAVVVLASPLKLVWTQSSLGWFGPFALWLALIVLAGWQSRR